MIGVNSQIQTGSSSGAEAGNVGIGFAIPSNTVKTFISEAKAGKLEPQQQQQQEQQQQTSPWDQSQGQQVDPNQQQVDPNQQQADPNQQQVDPNSQDQGQGSDPWSQLQEQLQQGQQVDPNSQDQGQAVPYGYGLGIG